MERPNTVSGLIAKRTELVAFRKGLEAELRKATCDIDHLDAAIRLFDPEATPRAIQRYAVKHRAKKGTVRRFVLNLLKEAKHPITSSEITAAWITARGLRTDDATAVVMRKRMGACLISLRRAGFARSVDTGGKFKGWTLSLAA